jgi:hypothetical protein
MIRTPKATMVHPRSGSVLILCFAIVISLTVVAYAFVRVAQIHNETSNSMNRQALANEAARMGTQHAMEQIIRDYVEPPGGVATQTPGFTRMDGPARAPFQNVAKATQGMYTGHTLAYDPSGDLEIQTSNIGLIDAQTERPAWEPMYCWWWTGYNGGPYGVGDSNYDGRGRFYEPNFYNLSATDALPTTTQPTVPVLFGDQSATLAIPTRSNAIFFDQNWRRISTGNPIQDRQNARFRLRYSVGVEDLDGAILVNPDPEWQQTETLPTTQGGHRVTTTLPDNNGQTPFPSPPVAGSGPGSTSDFQTARVIRYQNVIANMMWAHNTDGTVHYSDVARIEHVFLGRGMAGNYDINGNNNEPVTFPLMFRQGQDPQKYRDGNPRYFEVGNKPLAANLYATATAPAVVGTIGGGEQMGPYTGEYSTMRRSLIGPQFSFINEDRSMSGGSGEALFDADGILVSGQAFTPFGRGLSATSSAANYSHYNGPVDSPFLMNVMTAPMSDIWAAIIGYMPPEAVGAFYMDNADFPPNSNPLVVPGSPLWTVKPADASHSQPYLDPPPMINDPRFMFNGTLTSSSGTTASYASYWAGLTGQRDLFVTEMNPAFSTPVAGTGETGAFHAPSSGGINPNYHVRYLHPADPGYRSPANRYPGPVCVNGYNDSNVWVNDCLGMYLRAENGGENGLYAAWGGPATGAAPAPFPNKLYVNADWPLSGPLPGTGYKANTPWDPSVADKSGVAFWYGPEVWGASCGGSETAPPWNWQYAGWPDFAWEPSDAVGNWGYPGMCTAADVPDPSKSWTPPTPTVSWGRAYYRTHPYSIWDAVGEAMASAIMVARAEWMQYPTQDADPATIFNGGPWVGPTPSLTSPAPKRVMSVADIDALFLANLGIDINNPTNTVPCTAYYMNTGYPLHISIRSYTPLWNLASLRLQPWFDSASGSGNPNTIPGGPNTTFTATQKTAVMEMIINDMRLSFFGSSPGYLGTFKALDLNGDGVVSCSGTDTSGNVTNYFANSAVFYMGKSHFWEIISRGEVWDNVLQTTLSESLQDSVICVDPLDSAMELSSAPNPQGGQYATHVLYQRSFYDKYRGHLTRKY